MAPSENNNGQSRLRKRLERSSARRKGRVDGNLGLHCPIAGHCLPVDGLQQPDSGGRLSPGEVWTPFVQLAHDRASAASNAMAAALVDDNQQLIVSIYRYAANLVHIHEAHAHEARGSSELAAARGRFQVQVERWLAQLAAYRSRADTAVIYANLLIDTYWDALQRAHYRRYRDAYRCAGLRPVRAVLDPIWAKADPFLLLQFGAEGTDNEATARAGRLLNRAIDL
ncbi:hypothetical protein [Dactylosporangium sp. CA-139066]|uniref:hypothetical protein n=1 Tax=Dactylosporangium sp. CA-139066 TaxID=3239930 RepID=UPI003D947AF5